MIRKIKMQSHGTMMSLSEVQRGYIMLPVTSYLQLVTHRGIAKRAGAFWRSPDYGVLSWDNKLAGAQIDYILGLKPKGMSYVVGIGNDMSHHRGASIPKNKIKSNCKGGWKWRDTLKPNPNTLVGAMVAGPDRQDGFHDVRTNYNYTEPTTLAGNAGLVAALVALSGDTDVRIDKNTMFSAVPPMSPIPPPPLETLRRLLSTSLDLYVSLNKTLASYAYTICMNMWLSNFSLDCVIKLVCN